MGSSPHHGPVAVIITLPALLTACASPAQKRFEYAQIIMGVEARVVLYAPEENAARRAARAAFDRMADLDAVMSDYRVDSELSRLSRAAPGAAVAVSDDLYRVLQRARGFAEASGGAFDPTIGPLVTLWREARRSGRLPTDRALEEARRKSGWRKMTLDPRKRAVTLERPGMKLDLGAIGKGFAADEARAVLTKAGFERCLVDVGGDIAVGAPPPEREGWRIGVGSIPKPWFVTLARAGIATSGDAEQFVEIDGTRYSHIVDPATGLGLTERMQVTVVAPDATGADALASAASVLGTVDGTALVERFPGSSVMFESRYWHNSWRLTSRSFPPPAEGSPGPTHLPARVESAIQDLDQTDREGRDMPDTRLDWWREARFGMFIHWGLYAIPAGTWKGKPVGGVGEWIMHHGQIPVEQYEPLQAQFDPVRFDADEWARTARDAGMKYLVITTKHHDGFCLFNSAHTGYDVMGSPFGRDVMKELAEACRRVGLRIGWYHSILDWHHPDYLPRQSWDTRPAQDAHYERYVTYLKGQLTELLTNYGPIDVMWFDGEWEATWTHPHGVDLYDFVRRLRPEIIINNRVDKGRAGMEGFTESDEYAGDFGTPEQQIPATGLPGVDWETCMTMNDSWGYKKDDHHWKSSGELIRTLADVASKGGNFLLNVGPTASGEIPRPSVERLEAVGAWLKRNGESIYGTQASPFKRLPWGRCTQKPTAAGGTALYLHVFEWPADGRLVVPGLRNEIRKAYLLADENRTGLQTQRTTDEVIILVPAKAPHPADSVVVVEITPLPVVIQ